MAKSHNKRIKLDIVDITPSNFEEHPPMAHPVLPQHEFSMLVIAPKGSGKTNFICNLLTNHLKGYFHAIDICSSTVNGDAKWSVVKYKKHILAENKRLKKFRMQIESRKALSKLPPVVHKSGEKESMYPVDTFDGRLPSYSFFDDMDEVVRRMDKAMDEINQLKIELGEKNEEKAKFLADRRLVIIDDKAGCFGSSKRDPLAHKVMLHRHHNYSMIMVTQQYHSIPNQIRTNTNAKILFNIPNESELETIYNENPAGLDKDSWYMWYRYCMRKEFAFMYINDKFRLNAQVYCNFTRKCLLRMPRDDNANNECRLLDANECSSDDDDDDNNNVNKK